MEETVKTLRLESLYADKINGVDIFEYIHDQLKTLKLDLEEFIEAFASRKHLHGLDDVQGLLGALQDLTEASQPRGSYATQDHTHDIKDIKNVLGLLNGTINEALLAYSPKDHTHTEYSVKIDNIMKILSEYNKLIEVNLNTNKAQTISITDLYCRVESIEKSLDYLAPRLDNIEKILKDLQKRDPIEIVIKVRDEEDFIVPVKAGKMNLEIRATDDAVAQVFVGAQPLAVASGGEKAKVVVNKPCLVHLIFRE